MESSRCGVARFDRVWADDASRCGKRLLRLPEGTNRQNAKTPKRQKRESWVFRSATLSVMESSRCGVARFDRVWADDALRCGSVFCGSRRGLTAKTPKRQKRESWVSRSATLNVMESSRCGVARFDRVWAGEASDRVAASSASSLRRGGWHDANPQFSLSLFWRFGVLAVQSGSRKAPEARRELRCQSAIAPLDGALSAGA
jgi:hypothetical protein